MQICLDDDAARVGGGDGDGGDRAPMRFTMVLDEQWRGSDAAPSMRMV